LRTKEKMPVAFPFQPLAVGRVKRRHLTLLTALLPTKSNPGLMGEAEVNALAPRARANTSRGVALGL
jgi:hypothetical protein